MIEHLTGDACQALPTVRGPMLRTLLALGLLVGAAAGCSPITDIDCDLCTSSAIVYGTVTSGGAAVANAEVVADISDGTCVGTASRSLAPSAFTSAAGAFRLVVRSPLHPAVRCVIVGVRADASSGLAPASVTLDSVRLVRDYVPTAPPDSVRLDVQLSALP